MPSQRLVDHPIANRDAAIAGLASHFRHAIEFKLNRTLNRPRSRRQRPPLIEEVNLLLMGPNHDIRPDARHGQRVADQIPVHLRRHRLCARKSLDESCYRGCNVCFSVNVVASRRLEAEVASRGQWGFQLVGSVGDLQHVADLRGPRVDPLPLPIGTEEVPPLHANPRLHILAREASSVAVPSIR